MLRRTLRTFRTRNIINDISNLQLLKPTSDTQNNSNYHEKSILKILEKTINSNQQNRFITLIDVIYDKNIPIAVTASQNLDKFTSSQTLENQFKRTISRLYELTSKEYKQ